MFRLARLGLPRLKFKARLARVKLVPILALSFTVLLFMILYLPQKLGTESLIYTALDDLNMESLVEPDVDTLLINGLKDRSGPKDLILIAVTSHPTNEYRRSVIRKTWAKKSHDSVLVIFFTGKPQSKQELDAVAQEAVRYGDLIVDDFPDNQYTQAVKTLRLFKYFKMYHRQLRFLVKTTDDVFINVWNLYVYCFSWHHQLQSKQHSLPSPPSGIKGLAKDGRPRSHPPFHFLGGVVQKDRPSFTWNVFSSRYSPSDTWATVFQHVLMIDKIRRDQSAERVIKEPLNEYMFPSYAHGNFYVISRDAVVDILEGSRSVPMYHLEDVFVTGVMAKWMLGVEAENMPGVCPDSGYFSGWGYWWYRRFSKVAGNMIAYHCNGNMNLMETIYEDIIESGY